MTATHKPRIPDIAESVFDICYLVFDLVAGIIFLCAGQGQKLFVLYAVLTLTLCFGDAFHLVPRVTRALKGPSEQNKRKLGLGLQISSITMTFFYVILLYIWECTFPELTAPMGLVLVIWVSALIRVAVCLLPQNNWLGDGNMRLSMLRNGVFLITGIGVIILYAISGNAHDYHMTRMIWAIIISFGCYIPVTLFSKKKPMIGMLMIPKTCAYIWMIAIGLHLMGTCSNATHAVAFLMRCVPL